MENTEVLKIYKNGKLLGPEIEGFFKAIAGPGKGRGINYTVESLNTKESWCVELSVEDVERILRVRAHSKGKTHEDLSSELKRDLEASGAKGANRQPGNPRVRAELEDALRKIDETRKKYRIRD